MFDVTPAPMAVDSDCILFVQKWNRATRTLGDRMEVYIPSNWPVFIIAACLAELTGILDYYAMEVLIVQPTDHLPISCLGEANPIYSKRWLNVSGEKSSLKDMGWYLRTGDLIICQNSAEVLRELNEAEKLSVFRAREADSFSSSSKYYFPGDIDSFSTNTKTSQRSKAVGIHIRKHTQKDATPQEDGSPSDLCGSRTQEELNSADSGVANSVKEINSDSNPLDIEGVDHDKSKNVDDIKSLFK